jgi:MFS family permease
MFFWGKLARCCSLSLRLTAELGVATIGQGLVKTKGGLIACRFLVGFFEAGFFPGCVYLISMYYKRYELQWRLTLFFSASILAGAFGGVSSATCVRAVQVLTVQSYSPTRLPTWLVRYHSVHM